MLSTAKTPEGKRILIVDDDSEVALMLTSLLERIGYLVIGTANNGDAAIRIAGEKNPDVILMDIHLTGEMDGIDTARKIKGLYGTPIIFLTADGDTNTIKRAVETQAQGFLVKPLNTKELFASIESVLLRKHKLDTFIEQQIAADRPICPCATPMIKIYSKKDDRMLPVGWVCPNCHHFVQGI